MIDSLNLLNSSQLFNAPANSTRVAETNPDSIAALDLPGSAVQLSLSPEAQRIAQKLFFNTSSAKNVQIISRSKSSNESTKPAEQSNEKKLSQEQSQIVQKLSARDRHVKNHEAQHLAVAGAYATGGPVYSYTTGPDGKQYAVGGEVQLNMSPVSNNPEATIAKAEVIRRGALAPADPSGADLAVAATATQMEYQARQELTEKTTKNLSGTASQSNLANNQYQSKIKAYQRFLNPSQTGLLVNRNA